MAGLLLVFAAAAGSYVFGVRLVKRREGATRVDFNFHFEPAFKDRRACDAGRILNESECRAAFQMLTPATSNGQAFRGPEIFDEELGARKPAGCYINIYKGGWKMYYNPYAGQEDESKDGQWWQMARLCTGTEEAQWSFFELGDQGSQHCPQSAPFDRGDCLVAALQETLNHNRRTGRRHSLRYVDEKWHSHVALDPDIPTGCSIQTGTDWAFHFKSTEGGRVGPNFSRVCGPRSPNAQAASSLVASSNFVQQSRSNSSCAFTHLTCCEKYQCNTCTSRRRHATTDVTYCPWYTDLGCCIGSLHSCQLR